jgi:hypothetical protein
MVLVKQGTISVMFGCHSPIHSLVVIIAWYKLYHRLPNWWQIICIFLHDIGHWGKDYLDNYEQKKQHAQLGAKIAKHLFGQKGYDLIIGHNPYEGTPKSKLFEPDKYSWVIAPTWWLISNTYFEPKLQRKGNTRRESAIMFKTAMKENMDTGFKELGHEIYLKQWGHYQKISEGQDTPDE